MLGEVEGKYVGGRDGSEGLRKVVERSSSQINLHIVEYLKIRRRIAPRILVFTNIKY